MKNLSISKLLQRAQNQLLAASILVALFIPGSIASFELSLDNWRVAGGSFEPGSEPESWSEAQVPFNGKNEDYQSLLPAQHDRWSFTLEKTFSISEKDRQTYEITRPELFVKFASNIQRYYFNHELIYSRGKFNADGSIEENGFYRNFSFPIDRSLIADGENKIRVILEGHVGDEVFLGSPILLDSASANVERRQETVSIMLAFLYAFLGFYHLLLYSKRRQEDYNLFFGLFSMFLSGYIYTRSNIVFDLDLAPIVLKRIEYFFLGMASSLSPIFFIRFFDDSSSKFSRFLNRIGYAYFGVILIMQLLNLFRNNGELGEYLFLWQLSMPAVMLPLSLTLIIRQLIRGNSDAWRLSAGMFVLFFTIIIDILGAQSLFGLQNYGLSTYGFLVFVIGIALVLANKFLRVYNAVEQLNADLEKKVKTRTEELNDTLTKVNALKDQQDGDYFLTSLLVKPLGTTLVQAKNISIESFLKQKKGFQFRKRDIEIGGDINVAHDLTLQGRDYVLFLNGDAMGKSIQGAGGALVLGTVFQSIVERTKASKQTQNSVPERWLKDVFAEMHKVFTSFDGSMLMSVVMGLIDIKTGTLFFINAEHPFTVLYRDDKATFLEEDVPIRKLGTTIITSHVNIKVRQLEAGDSVVIGSDGRDDLMLGEDENGQRVINEDETMFLKVLEEAKGNLQSCFQILTRKGGITDDTSLLKVNFLHKAESKRNIEHETQTFAKLAGEADKLAFLETAAAQNPDSSRVVKEFLSKAYENNNGRAISIAGHAYFNLFPQDNDNLKKIAGKLENLKEYKGAISFAERFRLRFPEDMENMAVLARCRIQVGDIKKARDYVERLALLEGGESIAASLRSELPKAAASA